jgi:hypothetical protein
VTSEATTTAGTRAFVDAMLAHNKEVRAEIERAAADLARSGITGPVLDGLHAVAGHYDGARGRWEALSAAIKQHEALAEQVRATGGAASGMSFYTDDTKEAMTATTGATTGPGDTDGAGLPDAAGLGETEHWHGSDVVAASSGDGTVSLGLCQFPDSDAYVVVATHPPGKPWDPDSVRGIDPALNQKEAGKLADALDELADLAESDAPTKAPTRLEKLAARMRDLIGDSGVTIAGDQGEIEVSAADMRKILDAAAPEPAVPTRCRVDAKVCLKDNMDTGTVWAELDTSGAEPVVAVTSTEGERPEDYPEGYTTTRLSPAEARQLADKVRRFATTNPQAGAASQPAPSPAPAAPVTPVAAEPAQARRVTNSRGTTYEYNPADGSTAVIEPDGWRSAVPPSSSTGTAARFLWWNAEIKDGRGQDVTEDAARALLGGLTAAELREVAEAVGSSAHGARTKSQLVDAIVNMAIGAPRKHRALSQGWW